MTVQSFAYPWPASAARGHYDDAAFRFTGLFNDLLRSVAGSHTGAGHEPESFCLFDETLQVIGNFFFLGVDTEVCCVVASTVFDPGRPDSIERQPNRLGENDVGTGRSNGISFRPIWARCAPP